MRDDLWLTERFIFLWQTHFPDVTHGNAIEVRFGRASKTRLGSIVLRHKDRKHLALTVREARVITPEEALSIITVNGHFKNPEHPEEMIDAILIHEFCHYVHGFNSLLPKKFRHPHAGGIIEKEFHARGVGHLVQFEKKWVKEVWKTEIMNLGS